MVLLKSTIDRKSKDVTFIGIKVRKELASFLSLYCLSNGITKSFIVKKLIKDWYANEQQNETTRRKLVEGVVQRALSTWEEMPKRNYTYQGYKNILETELKLKGIDNKIIPIIFKRMDEEYAKVKK